MRTLPTGPKPRPQCSKPLAGPGRLADYCGRPEGHAGDCKSPQAVDRRRWARPARKAAA